MQKYRRSISYAHISYPGFVFCVKTGFAPAESVAADKSANSIRPRSSSPPQRNLFKDTCRADVSICNQKYLCSRMCIMQFRSVVSRSHGCSGAILIISSFHSDALPLQTGCFTDVLWPPFSPRLPIFLRQNYTVPFAYINFAAPNDASPRSLQGILEKTLETRSRWT